VCVSSACAAFSAHSRACAAGTLSPFLRACARCGAPAAPLPDPPPSAGRRFLPLATPPPPRCVPLDALRLARMPRLPDGTTRDWGAGILAAWPDISEARRASLFALLTHALATSSR
jgi:hypothetical protein